MPNAKFLLFCLTIKDFIIILSMSDKGKINCTRLGGNPFKVALASVEDGTDRCMPFFFQKNVLKSQNGRTREEGRVRKDIPTELSLPLTSTTKAMNVSTCAFSSFRFEYPSMIISQITHKKDVTTSAVESTRENFGKQYETSGMTTFPMERESHEPFVLRH